MLTITVMPLGEAPEGETIACLDPQEAVDTLIEEIRNTAIEHDAQMPCLYTTQRDALSTLAGGHDFRVLVAGRAHCAQWV